MMKQYPYLILIILTACIFITTCSDFITGYYEDPASTTTIIKHKFDATNYSGIGAPLDTSSPAVHTFTGITVTAPTWKSFEADAFFEIQGNITLTSNKQYMLIEINKSGETTHYWVRGTFTQKVWLRFGAGTYTVNVRQATIISSNLNYEGAITEWRTHNLPAYTFYVNNTRTEDGRYFYASCAIQSDAPEIINLANQIITRLSNSTLSNKIKAIHDYVVTNISYDDNSLLPGQCKKQDALSVLQNKTALSEGYTCLFNALVRAALRIESKYIYGNNHSWSGVYYQNGCSLIDTTWDDPPPNDHLPSNIRWKYFMKDAATFYADHTWEGDRIDK